MIEESRLNTVAYQRLFRVCTGERQNLSLKAMQNSQL